MATTPRQGNTAPQNVPSIAIDLLNLKYAQETDPQRAVIEKQKIDAKLAQMDAKNAEKNYNTVHSQLVKAWDALLKSQSDFNALKHGTEIAVEDRKQIGETRRQEMTQTGETQRKVIGETSETNRMKWTEVLFTKDLRGLGIDENTIKRMLLAKAGAPQQHEAAVMAKFIFESGTIPPDQRMKVWNSYNKHDPGTGSTGSTGSIGGTGGTGGTTSKLSDTEQAAQVTRIIDVMAKQMPLQVEDVVTKNNWPDKTNRGGETATPEQMFDYAYDMADVAMSTKIAPGYLFSAIDAIVQNAAVELRKTGALEGDPAEPGKIRLETPEDEQSDYFEINEELKRAQKIVNFFYGDAGKAFMKWLKQSEQAGRYVSLRRSGTSEPTPTQMPPKPDGGSGGLPSSDGIPGAPPPTSSVPGAPTHQGPPMTSMEQAKMLTKEGMTTPQQRVGKNAERDKTKNSLLKIGARHGIVPGRTVIYAPKHKSLHPKLRVGDRFKVIEFGIEGEEGFKVTGVELLREIKKTPSYGLTPFMTPNAKASGMQSYFIMPVSEFKHFRGE